MTTGFIEKLIHPELSQHGLFRNIQEEFDRRTRSFANDNLQNFKLLYGGYINYISKKVGHYYNAICDGEKKWIEEEEMRMKSENVDVKTIFEKRQMWFVHTEKILVNNPDGFCPLD